MTSLKLIFSLFIISFYSCSYVYAADLKKLAIEEFKKANYPKAIEILEHALIENNDDLELYYCLGYFTHYLCYDSVPLTGFDIRKSDEVLAYLGKAVELKPSYGDAYYFIGAEYGVRARRHLGKGEVDRAVFEFRLAREKGGLPDWLIEYGRNNLKTCDRDAILFTGGDADTNPIEYLQLVENYRRDVTVIPIALLNRPWFVQMIKYGIENAINAAPISWSREQIHDMHPYKWKTNLILIAVPETIKAELQIDKDFEWELEPDFEGRLSAGAAVLADIVKTNQWARSIYFSVACHPGMYHGLGDFFQSCGTTYRLIPTQTKDTELELDIKCIEDVFMDGDNYKSIASVADNNMPRASHMLNNYRAALFRLLIHYYKDKNKRRAKEVLDFMESTIREEYVASGALGEHLASYRKLLE
ncbi:MAG: hypothetical protein GTO42_01005 [Candidatus Latescibacteria bacterium]|nr:hypothetical protein [Candidatus Latescibacterota bacterium]NIO27107.1 hypothetical protein [Candidatus Latescibacterota bacterium]NIO54631.1 hypothetical protein [Candidatus Latescibacterota bacterium]NIT00714.1 hypothetical protein [Candidatus Latescibacterota bacterium]NIT37637.1 hypothetical protein [Candidatus Latescibacterota bacterium]